MVCTNFSFFQPQKSNVMGAEHFSPGFLSFLLVFLPLTFASIQSILHALILQVGLKVPSEHVSFLITSLLWLPRAVE